MPVHFWSKKCIAEPVSSFQLDPWAPNILSTDLEEVPNESNTVSKYLTNQNSQPFFLIPPSQSLSSWEVLPVRSVKKICSNSCLLNWNCNPKNIVLLGRSLSQLTVNFQHALAIIHTSLHHPFNCLSSRERWCVRTVGNFLEVSRLDLRMMWEPQVSFGRTRRFLHPHHKNCI